LSNSAVYGLGCLAVSVRFRLHKWKFWRYPLLG
jgi:hypothetical protein